MITKDQLAEIARQLIECQPDHMEGGPGTFAAPRVWYLGPDFSIQQGNVCGIWRGRVVCMVGGTPYVPESHLVFAVWEEALIELADRQKQRLESLHAEYQRTCKAALEFIQAEGKRRKAEKEDKKPKSS